MKCLACTIVFVSIASLLFAQDANIDHIRDSIVAEGKMLYRSEMASWYGTDMFMEKYKEPESTIGGYFSYPDGELTTCIFFSRSDNPQVIGTVSFDNTYKAATAKVSLDKRDFSNVEKEIYTIRKTALQAINEDTLFKKYKNTNMNLVPVMNGAIKKIYVLTATDQTGVVFFGNDYLLTFNPDHSIRDKKKIHLNIIPVKYGQPNTDKGKDSSSIEFGAVHIHLPQTGNFISATDICTLMLYEGFAKWHSHIVVSENYVSIWNCDTNSLIIVPRSEWDKKIK